MEGTVISEQSVKIQSCPHCGHLSRGQGGYAWFAFPPKTLPALNTDELEAPEEPVTAKGDAATGTAFDPPAQ